MKYSLFISSFAGFVLAALTAIIPVPAVADHHEHKDHAMAKAEEHDCSDHEKCSDNCDCTDDKKCSGGTKCDEKCPEAGKDNKESCHGSGGDHGSEHDHD